MRFSRLELAIILVIVFTIFGAGKLSQVGEATGRGLKSLRYKREEHSENSGFRKGIPQVGG